MGATFEDSVVNSYHMIDHQLRRSLSPICLEMWPELVTCQDASRMRIWGLRCRVDGLRMFVIVLKSMYYVNFFYSAVNPHIAIVFAFPFTKAAIHRAPFILCSAPMLSTTEDEWRKPFRRSWRQSRRGIWQVSLKKKKGNKSVWSIIHWVSLIIS